MNIAQYEYLSSVNFRSEKGVVKMVFFVISMIKRTRSVEMITTLSERMILCS